MTKENKTKPVTIQELLVSKARTDLAPTGKLRVALLPLPHIAVRDKDTGDFKGVVVDLSRALAKRLNVPVEFVTVNSNSVAVDQIKNGEADVTFLVGLPVLAAQIDFGATYIEYETSFSCQQALPFADWTTLMFRDSESLCLIRV